MKAYELIANPSRWTKGGFAKSQYGEIVDPCDSSAVCFCLLGALRRTFGATFGSSTDNINKYYDAVTKVTSHLIKKYPFRVERDFEDDKISLAFFNDNSTHIEIYNVLKELDL